MFTVTGVAAVLACGAGGLVGGLLPLAAALQLHSAAFVADYFRQRHVPHVCAFTCEPHSTWPVKFAREANHRSIAVSSVDTHAQLEGERIRRCLNQRFTNVGVLVDATCNTDQLLETASRAMCLDARHIWLIVDDKVLHNNTAPRIIAELDMMNISVDADIVVAKQLGPQHYKLYDIYNFGKIQGGDLKVNEVGYWSSKNGLAADLNIYKYYRRWDFGGWKMRMVSVLTSPPGEFAPALLTTERPTHGVSVITRTSTTIITVVAEVHNFQFVHQVVDRWTSVFARNNCKTAAVVSLYCRESDITSVLRYYIGILDRVTLIHPSLTYLETRYFYRIPTSGCGKYENEFLRPLSGGTWRCFAAVCALGAVLLVAAAALERRPMTVQYAFFSVLASICQQYFEDEYVVRKPSAGRKWTSFVTGMSCVLVYNYYTSSVVSWLLSAPPPSLASLAELRHSSLDLIYEDIGYTRSWLNVPGYYYNRANAKEEDAYKNKILSKKNIAVLLKPVEEGIAMVKAGGYAYHTESDNANRLIAETFTPSELCEVGSLSSMPRTLLYPGLQKDSPYKEFLTWSLTRLLERGVVSRVQRRTWSPAVRCEASSPRALALGGAAPAFILLAFGFVLATVIMLCERCICYFIMIVEKHDVKIG